MEFLRKATSYFSGDEFEDLYREFKEEYDIAYHDLFFNLMIIGYKKNMRQKLVGRGKEFKVTYFNGDQASLLYAIALADKEIGGDVDSFSEDDFGMKAKKLYEEYATGGAKYFSEQLGYKWKEGLADRNYKEYDIDLFDLIRGLANEDKVPF